MEYTQVLYIIIFFLRFRFDFVKKCWEDQAADRPTFSDTVAFLSQYLEESSGYIQLGGGKTVES